MSQLLNYIKPYENDSFSKFNGDDLTDLFVLLEDYNLRLRDRLFFDKNVTFGLEIEFENANANRVYDKIDKIIHNNKWIVTKDLSLPTGLEIDSPILRNRTKTWRDLSRICHFIEKNGIIGARAASHVHVGSHILNHDPNLWLNFIKLWSIYENIIFRFAYGEYLTARPAIGWYAAPLSKSLWTTYEEIKDNPTMELILKSLPTPKNNAVSFKKVRSEDSSYFEIDNTIEFRCPNGTLDPVIWQNNVNLFVNLLLACRDNLDDDILNKRHDIVSGNYDYLRWYDEIYLEEALEFIDIIFCHNFDKLYFLKQYLKSFQVCQKKEDYLTETVKRKKLF